MPDHGMQLEVTYTPAFGGGTLTGPGRWVETDEGYVWTNDGDNLNLLDFDNYEASQGFIGLKDSMKAQGLSASEAFDLVSADIVDENPEAQVVSGNLEDLVKEYESKMGVTPTEEPIVAAAPTPEDLAEGVSFGITVDETDDSTVLELVKNDPNGVYYREDEAWIALDPDADEDTYPTVYGPIWYDVTSDAIPVFDDAALQDSIEKAQFDTFIVP